jgi:predicted XRE-type DNA-binding protein
MSDAIENVEMHPGSSNVFADLELPDANWLKITSGLTIEITKAVRKHGLTQNEAAQRMGLTQPKVSALLRGEFSNFSERKLMDCLNRLGYDIEIRVHATQAPIGHLTLTHA